MSEQQFDIIFRGDIVLGHQLADVKIRLQQLFKADAAKIDTLFTGKPVPLKRNLDDLSAQKYRDVLFKAGIQVEVKAVGDAEKNVDVPSAKKIIAEPAPATKQTTWTLAPVGSYLLQSSERIPFVSRTIDTSTLSLRPEGGNLLDANEQQVAPVVPVVAPDFEVAEAGADLIGVDEKMDLPFLEIELEDWTIAEVGADLVNEFEKIITPAPVIHIPDVGLAPAGSDLGQLKPLIQPVTPNISGLSLADL